MSATQTASFVERRNVRPEHESETIERRQFAESRDSLSPEVRELANAIDAYKLSLRRRYVTLAEVLDVVKSLGYHK
jgi:hypothetical protein